MSGEALHRAMKQVAMRASANGLLVPEACGSLESGPVLENHI
jgi:hypothetical protein